MGIAVNMANCNKCGADICLVLEWKSKEEAIKELQEVKCPKCGASDYCLTDEMGQ
jgi:DNA-directed RNA polymerase subunit RPC12/RpoP